MQWRSWLSAAFGIWFIIAPWILGFVHDINATWGSLIAGAILLVVSVWQAITVDVPSWRTWQSWIGVLCGFWFIIHPFLGRFEVAEYYAIIVPGILTMGVNFWTLMSFSGTAHHDGDPGARI